MALDRTGGQFKLVYADGDGSGVFSGYYPYYSFKPVTGPMGSITLRVEAIQGIGRQANQLAFEIMIQNALGISSSEYNSLQPTYRLVAHTSLQNSLPIGVPEVDVDFEDNFFDINNFSALNETDKIYLEVKFKNLFVTSNNTTFSRMITLYRIFSFLKNGSVLDDESDFHRATQIIILAINAIRSVAYDEINIPAFGTFNRSMREILDTGNNDIKVDYGSPEWFTPPVTQEAILASFRGGEIPSITDLDTLLDAKFPGFIRYTTTTLASGALAIDELTYNIPTVGDGVDLIYVDPRLNPSDFKKGPELINDIEIINLGTEPIVNGSGFDPDPSTSANPSDKDSSNGALACKLNVSGLSTLLDVRSYLNSLFVERSGAAFNSLARVKVGKDDDDNFYLVLNHGGSRDVAARQLGYILTSQSIAYDPYQALAIAFASQCEINGAQDPGAGASKPGLYGFFLG